MHKILFLKSAGLLLAIFSLLICCPNDPIFYYLENEEPLEDRNLSNSIAVTSVTETQEYLYAAAQKIYRRRLSGSKWSTLSSPSGVEYVYSIAGSADGTLYCAGIHTDDNQALYSLAPGSSSWVEMTGLTGDYFALFSSGGHALIGIRNSEEWVLYSSEDNFASGLNCGSGKWGGAVYADTAYFSGMNDIIKKDDGTVVHNFDSSTSIADLKTLSDNLYTLFDDKLYRTADPGGSPITEAISDSGKDTLTTVGFWNTTPLAGTKDSGLFELDSGKWQLPDDKNYHLTPLPTASIRSLFTTSRGDILVSTYNEGFWCREYDSLYWLRE